MVAGNLIRKINKLKQEKEKAPDDDKKKIDEKIEKIYSETKLLKTLDPYPICKKVTLKPSTKYWNDVISNTKSTSEDRLSARIMCKNNVQKQVAKFKTDHKDCDEWLEEYFEYREKKKELETSARTMKKKLKTEKKPAKVDSEKKSKFHKQSHTNKSRDVSQKLKGQQNTSYEESAKSNSSQDNEEDSLHPSWASKRKEKKLLKAALSGQIPQPRRIILNER